MSRFLIVKKNNSMLFPDSLSNAEVSCMYKKTGKLLSMVRTACLSFRVPIPSTFYNSDLRKIQADLILVQDADAQIPLLKWLRKYHPDSRIILWYWNTVEERMDVLNPAKIPADIEKWSYSEYDCRTYNMTYNTTFYPYEVDEKLLSCEETVDVTFVGKNKGRLAKLLNLQELLETSGLTTDFHICKNGHLDENLSVYKPLLPYKEIVAKIARSRAIVDLCVSENAGPTIRPLEALYFRKKLITDDVSVLGRDFYHPDNVFVIGKDDPENLYEFVKSPYHDLGDELRRKYTMEEWVKRFY